MHDQADNNAFAQLVAALEPWLRHVVIVGGWAHRLYRLHSHAQPLEYAPLMTVDADVAIPSRLPVQGQDLRERLIGRGFAEERFGEDKPPATHYQFAKAKSGFFVEFLTPLTGSEQDRRGQRKATKRIAGVVSQQLRYLEVLLLAPWAVDLGDSNGFPLKQTKTIQIANPVCFIVQKLLIHGRRDQSKSAKDILYIHDTLEVFGSRIEELNGEWRQRLRQEIHAKTVQKLERSLAHLFGELNDVVRQAARIAAARRLSPEVLLERCRFGLRRIFEAD